MHVKKKTLLVSHLYDTYAKFLMDNGNEVVHLKVVVCYSDFVLYAPTSQRTQNTQLAQDN